MTIGDDGDGTSSSRPADPVRRTYGQEQINARFGVKNRATMDPFLAVPMYSHQFVDETRTLPELKARANEYVREFFPEELWGTLEGRDAGGPKGGFVGSITRKGKERRGTKRKSAAAIADGDPFASDDEVDGHNHLRKRRENETDEERKARIEAAIKDGEKEDGEAKEDVDLDEEEAEMSQEDDEYDDDEGGDYDAELYFDGGDNDDIGDDEGGGEGAMDF